MLSAHHLPHHLRKVPDLLWTMSVKAICIFIVGGHLLSWEDTD
jgi:hypothetical protein